MECFDSITTGDTILRFDQLPKLLKFPALSLNIRKPARRALTGVADSAIVGGRVAEDTQIAEDFSG